MGAVLGFTEPSAWDRMRVVRYGDPDWRVTIRSVPTPEYPLRAYLTTMTTGFCPDSPEHAQLWANHPGQFPILVRHYLAWANGTECAGRAICTCPPLQKGDGRGKNAP